MNVVDGLMPMRATFRLDVNHAEPLGAQTDQSTDVLSFGGHLRAAAQRKTRAFSRRTQD
ncbi:hypothetical protein [Ruegeria profundi]|uniref:hypothetical protein n=1 Tax=Ruegeria profundi TaxID=1685378 RepID=UPI000A9746B3|nr:hypothetical protein [Ruegeria profundi]